MKNIIMFHEPSAIQTFVESSIYESWVQKLMENFALLGTTNNFYRVSYKMEDFDHLTVGVGIFCPRTNMKL